MSDQAGCVTELVELSLPTFTCMHKQCLSLGSWEWTLDLFYIPLIVSLC